MKRHLIRLLIAILSFLLGIGASRLLIPDTPAVKQLPNLETYQPKPVQTVTITAAPPVQAVTNQSQTIIDLNRKRFDPSAFYAFATYVPDEFEEMTGLFVYLDENQYGFTYATVGISILKDGKQKDSMSNFALITEKKLFFATLADAPDKFEYRFEGTFLRRGIMAEASAGQVVLKGTLTKAKNGVKVAERSVKLVVENHGC